MAAGAVFTASDDWFGDDIGGDVGESDDAVVSTLVGAVWTASVGLGIIAIVGFGIWVGVGFVQVFFFDFTVGAVCGGNDDISSILGGVVNPFGWKW